MKHIPVIFQHQKCKAAGTKVTILKEIVLKKHRATAWQQKK